MSLFPCAALSLLPFGLVMGAILVSVLVIYVIIRYIAWMVER